MLVSLGPWSQSLQSVKPFFPGILCCPEGLRGLGGEGQTSDASFPSPPSASPGGTGRGQRLAGHNVLSLWGGVKETCPAGSWGHGPLVMEWPSQGTGHHKTHSPLSSHLRRPSVAREHSLSHFQKLWENLLVGHMVLRGKSQFFDFFSLLDPTGLCLATSHLHVQVRPHPTSRVVLQAERLRSPGQ